MRALVTLCFVVLLLVGCTGNPPKGETAKPDLAGNWVFEVQTGSNVAHGAMKLAAAGNAYNGTLTTDQGNNVLTIRSLTVDGRDMNMLVESPNGNVTFTGTLNADATSFAGTVVYHNGQKFPMSGRRP
jgi:hypothetical protein